MSELRNPRLAITAYDPNDGTYPSSPADTYWIIFVDATYDKTDDGQQTVTKTDRQTSARVVARSLVDEYLERDTLVEVIWDNGRWWIARTSGLSLALCEITNDSYDTIYWDATIEAHYVYGRPMDEAAEPIAVDGSADEEKLYITAFFRDQFDRNEGLGSFAKGRRVYTANRNGRREIVAPIFQDPRWMQAQSWDESVPPGGIAQVSGSINRNGRDELEVYQDNDDPCYASHYMGARYHVIADANGEDDGSDYLRVARAVERPIWAAVEDGADKFTRGQPYGPIHDSWLLYPGLPGYIYVGRHQLDSDGIHRALVIRDLTSSSWLAKAAADWVDNNSGPNSDWVLAYPAVAGEGDVYDGSESYLPKVTLRILLPRNGSSEDPNVHVGDYLFYGFHSTRHNRTPWNHTGTPLIAHGTYLDGVIGEVRMHAITFSNAGWVVADGTANAAALGGTGYNRIDTFPQFKAVAGGSGGAATHLHTVSSGLNDLAIGVDLKIDSANHLPPWSGLIPYERIH